jgi:hypothetical protein
LNGNGNNKLKRGEPKIGFIPRKTISTGEYLYKGELYCGDYYRAVKKAEEKENMIFLIREGFYFSKVRQLK